MEGQDTASTQRTRGAWMDKIHLGESLEGGSLVNH